MNDFTKNELQEIEYYLSLCYRDPTLSKNANLPLLVKVQKLIMECCEHEFIGYMHGAAAIPYCNKCKRAIMEKLC